jgi:hypothetical protein
MSSAVKLPREGITTGTVCEYTSLEHKPWVLITGTPGTIADYTADGWEPEDGAWDGYDDETELVEFAICEYIPDCTFALLEGATLAEHRDVALMLRDDDEVPGHVAPRPLFNPLGPIAPEHRSEEPIDDE